MKAIGNRLNSSFKKFIKSFVSIFASREFAFIYCLIGTFGQITHCYFLLYSVSSFDGWFRSLQAIVLSIFISSSLLYFVSIADKDDEEQEYKRILRAINMFMVIEIAINLYYYAQHLLIQSPQLRLFDFIFAVVISCLLPITIKLYANSIRAKEWLKELEEQDKEQTKEQLKKEKQEIIEAETIADDKQEENNEQPNETGLVVVNDVNDDVVNEFYNKKMTKLVEATAREISNEMFKKHKTELLLEIQKMKNDKDSSYNFDLDRLNKYIEEQISQKIKEIPENEDKEVSEEQINIIKNSIMELVESKIKENMNLFLKQFDNRVDYRIRQYGIKTKNEQFTDNN